MELKSILKMSYVSKLLLFLIIMLLMINRVYAMYPKIPFPEVVQSADIIFIGTAVQQDSYFNEQQTSIITEVRFEDIVIVHCAGQAAQENSPYITLKYTGGCVGDLCLDTSIAPSFREGNRYLLCMTDDGKIYANPIVGGSQGLFHVVKDIQTGEEYVITAGRKAILGANSQKMITSQSRVSYFKSGYPVYDSSHSNISQHFLNQPPTPANIWDTASLSSVKSKQEDHVSQALKLSGFIEYIKNVALKSPLKEKIIKKVRIGYFLKKSDKGLVRIPLEQWLTTNKNGMIEPGDEENFQTQNSVPIIPDNSPLEPVMGDLASPFPDNPSGGQLGYCGYHSLPFKIEMLPEDWWSYDDTELCRTTWNRFMDVYQKKKSDGRIGHNYENEFAGWQDDATKKKIYGSAWNGEIGCAHNWWYGNQCSRLIESDIIFNPAYNWTDNENSAIGNDDIVLLNPIAMHEMAHTWGMQRGKYEETYDYDYPTVMQSYYHHIVENGRGIHFPEAYCFRRLYSKQTGIKKNFVDIGVESYYASDGLHNSTTNSSTYYPGDSISLKNITVENNSFKNVSDLRIRLYLSKDRNITTQDHKIGSYWYWDSFEGESHSVFDIDSTIPSGVSVGTYYIGALVTVNGFEQDDFTQNNKTSFFKSISIKSKGSNGNDGESDPRCFIATAAFDSGFHPYVNILRDFRDEYLLRNATGRLAVQLYYKYSPFLAKFIAKHKILKIIVRNSLLPIVVFCSSLMK